MKKSNKNQGTGKGRKILYRLLFCSCTLLSLSLSEARQVCNNTGSVGVLLVVEKTEREIKVAKQHEVIATDLSPLDFFMENI